MLSTYVESNTLVVRVNLNVNLTAMTIDQVVNKMQHSYKDLLRIIIAQERDRKVFSDDEMVGLRGLIKEADDRGPGWFNKPSK